MHVHGLRRKVTSKTQVRRSSGASHDTYSCRSGGDARGGIATPRWHTPGPWSDISRRGCHACAPVGTVRSRGSTVAGEFDDIRLRLETISEELADLAIERLRESIDAGGNELPVDERPLTSDPTCPAGPGSASCGHGWITLSAMSGARSDKARRQALERARLARLVRVSITFVAVSLLVDAVGSRVRGGPAASDASATTTTSSPPVTLVPLPSTPGVAPVVTRVEPPAPVFSPTTDDGHPPTPEVQAPLEEAGVPASLFLLDGPVE